MKLALAHVAEASGAELIGIGVDRETAMFRAISGWSIDSRTVAEGDLFIALEGENQDGHRFVRDALARGASAALVSRVPEGTTGMLLLVPDTLHALQRLANYGRRQWNKPVVAVTGSAGKTSTKDLIADLLGTSLPVGKTSGNFNNHIGLPLSILRLPDTADVGVLEMGMNHAGEIRLLAQIAEPQIGLVTNVGYAHVEAFDSIEGVAAAKRELIEELPANGTAVLNADDELVRQFADKFAGRTITFGFSPRADVRGTEVEAGPARTEFSVNGIRFETSLPGRHSVLNILAGLAVAQVFGLPLEPLAPVIAALRPTPMRGERSVRSGVTILNDSYNSNPEAARSMLDVLRHERAERRVAVLGEMLELGSMSDQLHRSVGRYAAAAGVDLLIGVAGASESMIAEALQSGLSADQAKFFVDPESAGEFLRQEIRAGDAVLFKGSRGTHVERALATMET